MPKLVINDITSGYASVDTLNSNFTAIETALENTLSRDGTTPNSMSADLDMNGYTILNQRAITGETNFVWKGTWVVGGVYAKNNLVYAPEGSYIGNTLICVTANTAGGTLDGDAAKWAVFAQRGAPGASGGDVQGPASSVLDYLPQYSNTTGKVLKGGVPIGVGGVQAYDAELAALATSTAAANKVPYFTSATTSSTLDWNSATALANSATTMSSNTVIKTAIDDLVVNCATATPDTATDYFVFEDATDNTQKKALLSTIASTTFGTVKSYGAGTLSGVVADFTNIPSGVKHITLNLSGLSTNGASNFLIQLGDSGGSEASGYLGASGIIQNAGSSVVTSFTTGFGVLSGSAGNVIHGVVTLTLIDSATNLWAFSATTGWSSSAIVGHSSGSKALSGTLDRIRLTTVGGVDTFDAGIVNIIYA